MNQGTALEVADADPVTDRLLVGGDLDLYDRDRAEAQLCELLEAGVTHVVDCRIEADETGRFAQLPGVDYLHHGIDDAGQGVPDSWFDAGTGFVLDALTDPAARVLTHCHMGINRGPSLAYAVLLALGWEPVAALAAIREARPVAGVGYAEDALGWHHRRTGVTRQQRRADREHLAAWRLEHPLDVVRILAGRPAHDTPR